MEDLLLLVVEITWDDPYKISLWHSAWLLLTILLTLAVNISNKPYADKPQVAFLKKINPCRHWFDPLSELDYQYENPGIQKNAYYDSCSHYTVCCLYWR